MCDAHVSGIDIPFGRNSNQSELWPTSVPFQYPTERPKPLSRAQTWAIRRLGWTSNRRLEYTINGSNTQGWLHPQSTQTKWTGMHHGFSIWSNFSETTAWSLLNCTLQSRDNSLECVCHLASNCIFHTSVTTDLQAKAISYSALLKAIPV